MARFKESVESASALAAATTFANLVAGAAANAKIRRLTAGFRTSGAITSQQITIAAFRATARGTATTTVTPLAEDPRSAATAITGLDTVWSTAPTLAANAIMKWSINTQSGSDLPLELPDEMTIDQGTANGMGFQIIGNALPTGYILTLDITHDE
jgi:hypothetical protein